MDPDREARRHITREQFVSELILSERRIRGLLTTLLADGNDVDELLQEVSLIAWERHEDFTYVGDALTPQFRAWLVAIAKNKVRQLLHGKKNFAFEPTVIAKLLEAQSSDSLGNDPRREALPDCLAKLAPRPRAVLAKRYGHGMPVEQIARCEQLSPSSIYKLLAKTRTQLLNCITQTVSREAK